jgi:hypothetical protein
MLSIADFLGHAVLHLGKYLDIDNGTTRYVDIPLEPAGRGSIQLELRVKDIKKT